ncbi:MAG: PDZ domain-containing protein [Symploca sp. SIO3C6]|uniref:PDZ domain-containing protein n=1 Tax=Symploca sp. SIO1C4 TaxID=2607765 RepID=A0A6B3N8E9_9CYAN|nr:PDZ domain-containing protein [Symploca sp. SIO3C6]NER27135.1 PDZ domain-containing protein [Symploca sp. SIO1C4]NET08162.1 PDZ domain-containing protein [Symploca sp. SIO2B6]
MVLETQTPKSHQTTSSPVQKTLTYLLLVLLGASITSACSNLTSGDPSQTNASPLQSESNDQTNIVRAAKPLLTQDPNFVTTVVETVGPAVVRINASRTVTTQIPDAFDNPMFRDFFGFRNQPRERVERGTGSGFIIGEEGRILSNAHVIDGADTVEVILKDGRSFKGKVLGSDSLTDVAVIKIEAENLPTVSLGDSDQLRSGEWAIAIGNPLGLDNTVTTGIISATGRSSSQVGVPDKRVEFIQTDAAINPGNSGGPLLNASGEVVGMNTAIIQGAQGLGFAVPINTVVEVAKQLITQGKVEHPYLGIQMVTLTPELKDNINSNPNFGIRIEDEQGVLIARVMPNSPAARAGLRAGDIILKIDTQSVKAANDVQKSVQKTKVGSTLRLELRRNQQNITLEVQPGAFPSPK